MNRINRLTRRHFLASAGAGGVVAASGLALPSYLRANQAPTFTHGIQSGDISSSSGMVWGRVDKPARILFEASTTESFSNPIAMAPLNALPDSDYAVKRMMTDLPVDQTIFYRMKAADLSDINMVSEPITGSFRTAPTEKRDIRFVWSGDTAGQGWGIDETGMKTYATMARHEPDFFIHSGDTVYADGPMKESVDLPDGRVWKNVILTDEKRKVAETLDEYRGQWKYNMMDSHLQAFNAAVPTLFQWDDHEVVNNWSSAKNLSADDRYSVKDIHVLAARASRAFHEMTPISYAPAEPGRVYRTINYGPSLDIFFLDLRSYRDGNNTGLQNAKGDGTTLLGETQIAWLKNALKQSTATWKVIACDMPIGLLVWDTINETTKYVEAVANGDNGMPMGREMEIADLLKFIKDNDIANTLWLTADVHYTAAHEYHPDRAAFQDFEPFWEFVSGPIHAGTFGPNDLDMTFGPEVKFVKAPPEGEANLPPSAGLQFFGMVEIDGDTEQMTVRLMDRDDNELWQTTIDPKTS
ncbi:alkaline phosphatase [Notoacmeibacter sp. MSK16QG-6]|uniref:alkaline phosphatase D family protein n=1 Tax=Notoacmeibacter sp. MSK16QG-6 TaxID=2957982 RepID=UPI0020A20072|nr:alkaline phosphatase D family protein [Notoacmeibacter sp. MSK16QG-6]MCP1199276.1 alkaline phosphatase D family protein [Notoacmeibacter sp. MSK16QG-6]